MFGKKKAVIIATITEEEIVITNKGMNNATIGDIQEVIKMLATLIQKETGIKAHLVLSKLGFEMI